MESAAHHRPSGHHGDGFVGVIYGDIGTTAFRCSVSEPVERNEFVQVRHETCGLVLGRVDEIQRKTDLSLDRAKFREPPSGRANPCIEPRRPPSKTSSA
jgi:hypothetical protein